MGQGAAGTTQAIIVMGVSGAGKTTVGKGIAQAMGWEFAEGDDFHPKANVEKMHSGQPLDDDDRWPWLEKIAHWLGNHTAEGVVVTCSALKRSYRDLLRRSEANVRFCELEASEQVLADRVAHRTGHYMPASLLPSQLATLQPLQPDEPGVRVSVAAVPEQTVREALAALDLHPGAHPAASPAPATRRD